MFCLIFKIGSPKEISLGLLLPIFKKGNIDNYIIVIS